jgi:membrane protein implicated in regulation of membrane protease activity
MKTWLAFTVNAILLLLAVPLAMLIVWGLFFVFVVFMGDAAPQNPLFPDWMYGVAAVFAVLIQSTHLYQYLTGAYANGNPLRNSRSARLKERWAYHRSRRGEKSDGSR